MLNWIKTEDYSINTFLIFDRWMLKMLTQFAEENQLAPYGTVFKHHPHIKWYFLHKCPEIAAFVEKCESLAPDTLTAEELRRTEEFLLDAIDTTVVYAYPEVMETLNYITRWTGRELLAEVDFRDKLVLDVGSGTGRLAFAVQPYARRVYLSEPGDTLRDYLRDKIKKAGITNMVVLDGMANCLAFQDSTFDIVTSGHVIGDDYDGEVKELERVTKHGGLIVVNNGDELCNYRLDEGLVSRGFTYTEYKTQDGYRNYIYQKSVRKA